MVGCNKDKKDNGTHTVAGRLLDASNSEPIEGGTIYLDRGFSPWKTDSSSASGFYSFDIEAEHGDDLDLHAEAPRYFPNGNIGSWGDYYPNGTRPTGRTHVDLRAGEHDIYLPPIGYINFRLRQVNPYNGSISVRLSHERIPSGVKVFDGQGLNATTLAEVVSNRYSRILLTIIRNGDSAETTEDSVFVPRFDTVPHLIEF